MPKFSYMARDNSGAALNGELTARSEADAAQLLRREGKFVVRLAPAESASEAHVERPWLGGSRVKPDEVIYFCTQLAGMVDTGVPLDEALEATIDKAPEGAFRRTIQDVISRVQGGAQLSAALGAHPKVFPPLFVHMVRASEATGTIGPMLQRVAEYLTNQRALKKRIKGALTYPIFMILFALGSTIFMLTYVLPQFAAIYAGKKAILPLPTLILMDTSAWITDHLRFLSLGTLLVGIGAFVYFKTANGRYAGDWLRLHIPVLGKMYRQSYLTRTLRTLGTMLSSGVSMLEAVLITRDVVGNRLYGEVLTDVHRRLERGEQLTQALLDAPFFPRAVWQMLTAGERTGQLGPVMNKVADLAESDLKNAIRTATQLIEPTMIVIMGSIIGGIAIAMLLPIFQISKVITQ